MVSFVECSRGVIEHAARCIANVAVNGSLALTFFELKDTTAEPRIVLCTENLSEAIMSEGGLEILDMARSLPRPSCAALLPIWRRAVRPLRSGRGLCRVSDAVSCVVLIFVVQSCAKIGLCLWVGCGKYATGCCHRTLTCKSPAWLLSPTWPHPVRSLLASHTARGQCWLTIAGSRAAISHERFGLRERNRRPGWA